MLGCIVAIIMLTLAPAGAAADRGSILMVDGRRPDTARITVGTDPPPETLPPTDMERRLAGVLDEFRGSRFSTLFACVPMNPPIVTIPESARRVAVVHLTRRETTKRVELLRAADGRSFARELDPELESPRLAEMNRTNFEKLAATWSPYRGTFEPSDVPRRTVFEAEHPLVPGIVMDVDTIKQRMFHRQRAVIEPATRALDEAHLLVRVPDEYDPKHPAGLLVWISPSPDGAPPRAFDQALDRFGIIAVGPADADNNRHVSDRFQLAFDAIATCTERFHIDPDRIYLTGFSGGGRITSMLWGCYPDIVSGCIPIGGLNAYAAAPAGGGRHWPAKYNKPPGSVMRLLRTSRLAPMTGPPDFNYENTLACARVMERDGLDIRVFDYEDMGHTLPIPERFTEAFTWMDEPYRKERTEGVDKATRLLDAYLERFDREPPTVPRQFKDLRAVIDAAPWSEAAWEAVAILESAPPDARQR